MEGGVESKAMFWVFCFFFTVLHIYRELVLFLFAHSFCAASSKDYCINKTLFI